MLKDETKKNMSLKKKKNQSTLDEFLKPGLISQLVIREILYLSSTKKLIS
jgi:hypothetical protein